MKHKTGVCGCISPRHTRTSQDAAADGWSFFSFFLEMRLTRLEFGLCLFHSSDVILMG